MDTMMHPIVASLGPNSEQRPAITQRDCDIVVTAGAGAGKTLTLVCRYLSLLATGLQPRQIAAITFTRKAAREMRNRVRQAIEDYVRQPHCSERQLWLDHHTALDAARIGTIHSLCSEILRAHPAEAAVDPRFTMLEEADGALLKADAVDAALAWAASRASSTDLFTLFGERGLHRIIRALLDERPQARAVLDALPTDITAHWQECLRQRQQQHLQNALLDSDYRQALRALQQNRPARKDDRMALQCSLGLAAVADFQSTENWNERRSALRQLDGINLQGGSQKNWPDGKQQLQEVKAALKALRDWWRQQATLCDLELNSSDEALAAALLPLRQIYGHAEEHYRDAIRQRRSLDFDDLEVRSLLLLHENEEVCRRWRGELGAILVDEYQDTNGRQRDLINLLNGSDEKLFIVGDAKQSIYRFRGAEIAVFRQERARVAQTGRALRLSRSYRAHEGLVRALNALLRPVLGDEESLRYEWQEPFAPLVATRPDPAHGLTPPFVEIHLTTGSKSEGSLQRAARILVARLLGLKAAAGDRLQYSHVAILCQASSSFSAYEDALDAAAVPYVTVAGRGFFERPEIRDLLNALQAIADPRDDLALVGLLRSPVCGFSDVELLDLVDRHRAMENLTLWQTISAIAAPSDNPPLARARAVALVDRLHARVGRLAIADILKAFLDETGYRAALRLAGQSRALHNVDKLLELAHSSAFVSSGDFLEYIAQLRGGQSREGEARTSAENAVQIMSVHQAKGLEFPIVVIGDLSYQPPTTTHQLLDDDLGLVAKVNVESGEDPAAFTLAKLRDESQQAAESARLLYVAATRAREKLIFSGVTGVNGAGRLSGLRGWLKLLNASLQFTDAMLDFDADGRRCHELQLALANHCSCHIYEPNFTPATHPVQRQPSRPMPEQYFSTALLHAALAHDAAGDELESERVWRIMPPQGASGIPRHLLGTLVHDALNVWQFPSASGDESFLRLMQARVRQIGVFDPQRVRATAVEAAELLFRLRRHDLYHIVSQAQRRLHEVPYTLNNTGGIAGANIENGRIDLLYLAEDRWHVVDFKTDCVQDHAGLLQLKETYFPQLDRYRVAVERLLGVSPRCTLCLLDDRGQVSMHDHPNTPS